MVSFDAWGPNDEYPDDPDFECNACGCCFNASAYFALLDRIDHQPDKTLGDPDIVCPECQSSDIHGGGYYG